MKANFKKDNGFTLIELLVVISIIGMLSSVVLASLATARSKSRDAKVRMDMKAVVTALELYRADNSNYQVLGSGSWGGGNGWLSFSNGSSYSKAVTDALYEKKYLGTKIPQNTTSMIYLCNDASGGAYQIYAISARLENPTAADIANIQTTCNGTGPNGTYTNYGMNFAIGN